MKKITIASILFILITATSVYGMAGSGITINGTDCLLNSSCTIAGGPGGGYGTIQEEGSPLTARTVLNFVGTQITCADNAGTSATDCTISAASPTASTTVAGQTCTLGSTCSIASTNLSDSSTLVTGARLDNVFSSTGLLKRTGAATYTLDTSTYLTAESDPKVGTLTSGNFCKGTGSQVSCTDASTYAASAQTMYIGTTSHAINRTSGAEALTGITSIDGSAATLTTSRSIHGGSFNGSADVTNIIASTYGGTGNGFTKFTGPTTSEKTFTLPDSNVTLLYSGGALGTPASCTLTNCTFPTLNQNTSGTAANLSGTPTLPNGTLATTQSAGDNSTKLATTAYVDGQTARNYEVASDWSTTGTGFTNITGLGWSIGASASQTFDCYLGVQDASTTVGMVLGFTGPASPTAVTWRGDLLLTTQTAPTTQAGTGASFPTAIPSTACSSSCLASFKFWRVSGVIKNGTNSGTVQLQGKVSSGTGKIAAASACWVH